MKRALISGLFFSFLFLGSSLAFSQQDFGEVSFANSGPAAVQADFIRALAQLHNFEYDDAAEHFRAAQKTSPDFAMAYWGEAMTKNHPVWHEEDVAAAREAAARVEKEGRRAIASMKEKKMYDPSMDDSALIYDGELHAMLAAAEGKSPDAVAELKSMATKEHAMPLEFGPPNIEKPTDELLGELLLQLHHPAEARDAFQAALARTPGRKIDVEGLARADGEIAAGASAKGAANGPSASPPH